MPSIILLNLLPIALVLVSISNANSSASPPPHLSDLLTSYIFFISLVFLDLQLL